MINERIRTVHRRMAFAAVFFGSAAAVPGCSADFSVPEGAQIACSTTAECPSGFGCSSSGGRCVRLDLLGAGCTRVPGEATEETLRGLWRRTDVGKEDNAKEYLGGGAGYLGNYENGTYMRGSQFDWTLDGAEITEKREADTYREAITAFDGCELEQRRVEDGKSRHWARQ